MTELVYKGFITPIPEDGNFWVNAQQIAHIVGVTASTVRSHLATLEKLGSITQPKSCRYFRVMKQEGERQMERDVKHYAPRVVTRIAMRSNSPQALDFQEWALDTLEALQKDGVVYRDKETRELAMQQAADRHELATLRGEVAELRAEAARLQGVIDECQTDMNEGQVLWLGGNLAKRVAYLVGAQKGVRPRAPQLSTTVVVNNVLTVQTDKDRVLGYIAAHYQCTGRWASTSNVRTRSGRNTKGRMDKEDIQDLIDELIEEGLVEEVREEGRSIRRWRIR